MGLAQRDRLGRIGQQGFENSEIAGESRGEVGRLEDSRGGTARIGRAEEEAGRIQHTLGGFGCDHHPGPGVAALVQAIVHQPCVAADGDAAPGCAQIGLGGHRVLIVAQLVPHIGEQVHQHHPDVGNVGLGPVWQGLGQAIENQLPEAGVVLG